MKINIHMNHFGLRRIMQLHAAAGGQGLPCHEAEPGTGQLNCMTARWCQATPGQDGDEMARHHLPGRDACHQVLEWGYSPDNNPCDFFLWG
jgi:hypothetical protein